MDSTTSKTNNNVIGKQCDQKAIRHRLRVGDQNFVPPDGGWGWFVVFACGFSNLSTFPMFQQFGLVFKEKFEQLGITNTQTTTIINLNSAFNSCVGLLNGPLFRKFSYRQIAFCGACLVTTSLFFTALCNSFWTFVIVYSILYGSGIGVTQSANSLALNTYFKKKRRIATGLSWSTTALGPIIWPYIITVLMDLYGMAGTLWIFSALAGHAILGSLLLQPVHWHSPFEDETLVKPFLNGNTSNTEERKLNNYRKHRSLVSSQYLYNEDDPDQAGYEIIDPGTPRMVGANDGWYSQNRSLVGSRHSLTSVKDRSGKSRLTSGQASVVMSQVSSFNNLIDAKKKKPHNKLAIAEEMGEENTSEKESHAAHENDIDSTASGLPTKFASEKYVLKKAAMRLAEYKEHDEHRDLTHTQAEQKESELSFWKKVCIFFDFGLLNDGTYLVLMLGITCANFVEINFSVLTPLVLYEFNYEKYQIASFMSLLGATDIVVRLFVPFLSEKIGWQNKTFFLAGVLGMALGRIIHFQTYEVGLFVAVLIGFCKGLRTIFVALVIPSYVTLEKLPAASGLQLTASGLMFLIVGPVIGLIRDLTNSYIITLHVLNLLTYATAVCWIVHDCKKHKDASQKYSSYFNLNTSHT